MIVNEKLQLLIANDYVLNVMIPQRIGKYCNLCVSKCFVQNIASYRHVVIIAKNVLVDMPH
jgi:hypothetical protein